MFGKKTPETAQEIADAIPSCKTLDDFYQLILATSRRRDAIRALQNDIGSSHLGMVSGQFTVATAEGPAAVQALQKRCEDLAFEYGYLDRLEQLVQAGQNEARIAHLKRDIPIARSRLPRELAAVRKAAEALGAAVAVVNKSMDSIARYEEAHEPFPIFDDIVDDMLRTREQAWAVHSVAALIRPIPRDGLGEYEFVTRHPLAFYWRVTGSYRDSKGIARESIQYAHRYRRSDPQGFVAGWFGGPPPSVS